MVTGTVGDKAYASGDDFHPGMIKPNMGGRVDGAEVTGSLAVEERKFDAREERLLQEAYYRAHQIRRDWSDSEKLDEWDDAMKAAMSGILESYTGRRASRHIRRLLEEAGEYELDYDDSRNVRTVVWPCLEEAMKIMGVRPLKNVCAECGLGSGDRECLSTSEADIHKGRVLCGECYPVVAWGWKRWRCRRCGRRTASRDAKNLWCRCRGEAASDFVEVARE